MSLITRMRKQKAIYWKRTTVADQFGVFTFEAPVEIKCRWVDKMKEFVTHKGEKAVSQAVVYVDRAMSVGDRLKQGPLDISTPADPLTIDTAYEVQRFDTTPNLRNTEYLKTAYIAGRQAYG